jgi:hypothetical protein
MVHYAEVEEETFFVQFTAGGLAGGLAAAVTTPLVGLYTLHTVYP